MEFNNGYHQQRDIVQKQELGHQLYNQSNIVSKSIANIGKRLEAVKIILFYSKLKEFNYTRTILFQNQLQNDQKRIVCQARLQLKEQQIRNGTVSNML